VATKLGIVEHLREGPQDGAALAEAISVDAGRLQRLLQGCVRCGLLARRPDGAFALTELGEWLRAERAGSLRDVAILAGEAWYPAWGSLLHTLETGEIAFDHAFGRGFFAHLGLNPEIKTRFHNYMAARTAQVVGEIVRAYDLTPFRMAVDVGGGNGTLIAAMLVAHPQLRGVVFDSPQVIEETHSAIRARGLAGRCHAVTGNFFETVPAGGDLYILSQILHDWTDEQCVQILSNCRRAMPEGGRVLVVEQLMPAQIEKTTAQVDMDLAMLVLTGGRERTEAEFRELLRAAGFGEVRCIPTRFAIALIEGLAT
ncbi:MAG: methyltransferase, partial [Chloroflexales bacterium]|nr:methyltransferase [Chloroflexales bacterium]